MHIVKIISCKQNYPLEVDGLIGSKLQIFWGYGSIVNKYVD